MTRRSLAALLALLGSAALAGAQPAAMLGRPRALSDTAPAPRIRLASHELDPPPAAGPSFAPPSFSPPPFTPPDVSLSVAGDAPPAPPIAESTTQPTSWGDRFNDFGDKVKGQLQQWFQPGYNRECDVRRWFESDHGFDYFSSPVSNPFLFEDPRSLTEIKPVFVFQSIPNDAPNFAGGHAEFFGTQIRIAITEKFSFVMHKLGFVNISPGAGGTQPGGTGFAELHLGPKFTFLRSQDRCLLGAAGLIFHIPSGPANVYQDTGRLSLVPYVTFGKNFLENRFGSLNVINTTGYSFGDQQRSDYFYNSFHLDWDIANRHRWYPLLELHYFQYTGSGEARNLDVEGRDLANIGDVNSAGRANVNIATGVRWKWSERAQVGFAAEFPLNSRRDLQAFRFTLDFIFRY